jgi:hypothetical protein
VTGNHPTSTGPISIAASRTQVLVFITLVPRENATRVLKQFLRT